MRVNAEEDESNNVRKAAAESITEEDFQKVAVSKKEQMRSEIMYPTLPTGVFLLAYRQIFPGNVSQIHVAVIQGNTCHEVTTTGYSTHSPLREL